MIPDRCDGVPLWFLMRRDQLVTLQLDSLHTAANSSSSLMTLTCTSRCPSMLTHRLADRITYYSATESCPETTLSSALCGCIFKPSLRCSLEVAHDHDRMVCAFRLELINTERDHSHICRRPVTRMCHQLRTGRRILDTAFCPSDGLRVRNNLRGRRQ